MTITKPGGVFAAAVTPISAGGSIDHDAILPFLLFLRQRGCFGALLLGTTGEGPSLSLAERYAVIDAAAQIKNIHPDFYLLAGTGLPSLNETIQLTQYAFTQGFDAVVTLPPYFFRRAEVTGLLSWFGEVITHAVPADRSLFYYHIPSATGIDVPLDFFARLKDSFPTRFSGLKDSSANAEFAIQLGNRYASDLVILNGNDRLFSLALNHGASGCITNLTNIVSPLHRQIFDRFHKGEDTSLLQSALDSLRAALDRYPYAPAPLKALLHHRLGWPVWDVKPPLIPLTDLEIEPLLLAFDRSHHDLKSAALTGNP